MKNLILYEGPSEIDGAPIVAILTGLATRSRNAVRDWYKRMHPGPK